ncbi:MAG: Transcription termination factor NusA [Candidatus Levybacteria bacterium GW2011_GWB1_35_5]|nr:MAG: Transcription termination factor NusA [Candidatus Levybacteria bacterium GW2011_GWB1_35_5]
MPAIQRSEFALALNQVSNERGLDPAIVLETVQNAILAAYRKDHPEAELEEYRTELNANTGEAKIFHKDEDVTPPGFGRIAAQTAKQVILQKIREKEKETIMSDFKQKIGTIINGMVLRFAGPNVIVDIGKTEAIMPPQEQIPNEKYHLNQRLTVYVVEIKDGLRGEEVVVSRAANGLLEGLFKREVPEVAQGAVEIKAIEREAGNRSKIAVYSTQSGIDPVGSCVGQKGVRVQAIIAEFNGIEKIDIIQWQDDPTRYIQAALSPAKQLTVEIDEKEKTARVKVAPEELSLAIGKEGQNVRLASKLTGFRIEIEGDEKLSTIPKEPEKPVVEAKEKPAEVTQEVSAEPEKESAVQEPVIVAEQVQATDEAVVEVPVARAKAVKASKKEPTQQNSTKNKDKESSDKAT